MIVADDRKLFELDGFTGLNTVDRPTELKAVRSNEGGLLWPLSKAENINITNVFKIHGRTGYSLAVAGTYPHSLYSNDDVILFVEGGKMYSMSPDDFSVTEVARGLSPGEWVSYDTWNDRVYYTNGFQIGYIKDLTNHSITVPTQLYKYPLPPGQFIAYYRGRLYVAQGNVLWYSDVMADYYDNRKGFMQFEAEITMLRPVENGIYVSFGANTHFLKGLSPEDMTSEHALGVDAIPYTDIAIDGKYVGKSDNAVVMWASSKGVCIGDDDGHVEAVTEDKYKMGTYRRGAALFLNEPGDERLVEVLNQ